MTSEYLSYTGMKGEESSRVGPHTCLYPSYLFYCKLFGTRTERMVKVPDACQKQRMFWLVAKGKEGNVNF